MQAAFRIFSVERMIHFCEEISLFLGHIFVLFFRDKTESQVPCKVAGLFMQYFFTAHFAFMPLEAMQAYAMITNVIDTGGYFGYMINLAIGWGNTCIVINFISKPH